jgi:D-alanyl-D-alanine carboxypeptidase/D-alanyl-D-alanine-endopeptidase (penicillin-binding protein 4)
LALSTWLILVPTACATQPPPSVITPTPTPIATPAIVAATPTPTPTPPPPVPDADKLKAALAKVPSKGVGTTSMVVLDPDGETLYSKGDKPLTPASTVKILTTMAALDVLGPDYTFTTRVVSPKKGQLILVGGGDPMLMSKEDKSSAKIATLDQLVSQTVAALKAAKVSKVTLGYDDSLFSGPEWSPNWKASWKPSTPRISALMVDSGAVSTYVAAPDPAKYAAEQFAKKLEEKKITVSKISSTKLDSAAEVVASATSAPLDTIVTYTIRYSHNVAAEIMLRYLAIEAGNKPTFDGGSKALKAWLKEHGLWQEKMVMDGGSGLSPKAKVSASVLARAVYEIQQDPRYEPISKGFPVAGKNGTLKKRFDDENEAAGVGSVHAKTGTLSDVASLAGYLTTADGATLTFAAIANKTAGQRTKAYNWLDASAAAVASCGCR